MEKSKIIEICKTSKNENTQVYIHPDLMFLSMTYVTKHFSKCDNQKCINRPML